MNVNDLISQVVASTQQGNNQLLGVAKLLGQATNNEQAVTANNATQAAADIPQVQAVDQQTADINYTRSQLVQQLQAEANLDPTQTSNAYAASLADLTAINAQRKQVGSQLTTLAGKNLLDDPVGYIMAQINLPVVQAKAAALEQQAQLATSDAAARLDLLAKAKSTIVANTSDAVKDVQYKAAELKAREAQRQLDAATAATQSKVAGQLLQQVSVIDKVTDNQRQLVSMQIQAANWAESMAERKEAREERMRMAAERLADKKTKEMQEASLNTGLRAASLLLGYAKPVDLQSFKVLPNSPQKRALASIADTGTLGAGLEESWTTLMTAVPNLPGIVAGGNAGFAKFLQNTDAALDSYVSAARRTPDASGKIPTEKQARDIGITKLESDIVASAADPKGTKALTSTVWDSVFNPYKSQYKTMIDAVEAGTIPPLKGNVVIEAAKSILPKVPTDSANFRADDEQLLWNTIGTMVAKNQINANDAAKQMAQYYTASAAYNKSMYQYPLVGLPAQTNYMVKIKAAGMLSDTVLPTTDAMNETEIKKTLLSIAKAQATPSTAIGPGLPPFMAGAQAVGTQLGNWLTNKGQ